MDWGGDQKGPRERFEQKSRQCDDHVAYLIILQKTETQRAGSCCTLSLLLLLSSSSSSSSMPDVVPLGYFISEFAFFQEFFLSGNWNWPWALWLVCQTETAIWFVAPFHHQGAPCSRNCSAVLSSLLIMVLLFYKRYIDALSKEQHMSAAAGVYPTTCAAVFFFYLFGPKVAHFHFLRHFPVMLVPSWVWLSEGSCLSGLPKSLPPRWDSVCYLHALSAQAGWLD